MAKKRFMGINPAHKGYCTPMSKKTCTPRRKALARTLKKHHGFHKEGGETIPKPNYLFPQGTEPSHEDSLLYNTYFNRILQNDPRAIEEYNDIKKSGIPQDLSESTLYHLNLKKNAYDDASKYLKSPKKKCGGMTTPMYTDGALTPNSPYQLPYGMVGNIGAGIIDSAVNINENTGENVIGKNIASNTLRGAGTGASIGTMIAPGIGTAIGAGAGAIAGAVGGYFKGKSEKNQYIEDSQNKEFQNQQRIFNNRPQYFAEGGMPIDQPNLIEVEGKELEVSNGKVLKDFKNKESHANGGYQYEAKPGRVIIPTKDREKYLSSDNFTRNSMERRLILDQKKRESLSEQYKNGGKISKYAKGGKYDYLKPSPQNQDPNLDPEFIVPRKSNFQPDESMIDNTYQPDDLITNTPKINNQRDWSGIANQAATYLPVVYNTIAGFSKANKEAPIYNPYSDETLNTMRNRKIDLDPIRRDIYSQERVAAQPLGENQGSYLSRRAQLSANTQKALTDANLKAQEINNQYSADYASTLNSIGQQRKEADFAARHQTLANKYNQAQFLPKAITQAGQIGRENLNIPMYTDLTKNKYAMSLLSQGYTRDQAKAETDKAYGVQNSNRYQWLQP